MKKRTKARRTRNVLPEYEFSKGRSGKYARRFASGSNLVALAPDVAKVFPDSEAVNEVLRVVARIGRRSKRKTSA